MLNRYVEQSQDDKIWIRYNDIIQSTAESKLAYAEKLTAREKFLMTRFRANALSNTGYYKLNFGETQQAEKYFTDALLIYRQINDDEGIANASNNLAYIYKNLGDVYKALEYYSISLEINEKINNKRGISTTLNNIGLVYKLQGDVDKALEYYKKSLAIREAMGDKAGIAASLNNIGYVYNYKKEYDKALEYYEKCLALDEETGEKWGQATSLNNIGLIYELKNQYEKALSYFKRSLELNRSIGNKKGEAESLNFLGNEYLLLGKTDLALQNGKESIKLARELGYPHHIELAAELLSNVYTKTGNYKEALEMHKLSIQMRDSVHNAETEKASLRQQMKYAFEKETALNEAAHQTEIALSEEGKKRQKFVSIAAAIGLLLVLVFAIFVFNRYRFSQKQKQIIESQKKTVDLAFEQLSEKNKEVVDSIRYAKRIQLALLKEEEHVSTHLPEHFVLFKPKDIVSGDFYWSHERNGWWYIAVADCTGHGVPGAFLTMLGTAYLNEIVSESLLHSPASILDQLREKFVKELGYATDVSNKEQLKDGMDISLLRYNLKSGQAEWAGANNPLWVLRSGGENRWIEIKADKQPIGQYPGPVPFTNHTLELGHGDTVYIFSDGFADQFGGPHGKKFKYRPLQQKLEELSNSKLSAQKEILNETFESWKGKLEQVDDVCMIGIRI